MLYDLPITNVRLLACREDWQQMTPTERGRHCASCDREVIDFTQASAAELAAARAASADGRLCGHFRLTQLTGGRPLRFGLWARTFALILALVFGQGLTAREAWAQTRQAAPVKPAARRPGARPARTIKDVMPSHERYVTVDGTMPDYPETRSARSKAPEPDVYLTAEKMPEPPGGHAALQRYLRQHTRYPEAARRQRVEGKVFVSFAVAPTGQLTDVQLLKGIGAGCDEEALRLIRQLPTWTPGRQNGRAVAVRYTLPVTFQLPDAKPHPADAFSCLSPAAVRDRVRGGPAKTS